MPAAQTGHAPSVAPATNATAPPSASRNAASGRATPSRSSASSTAGAAGRRDAQPREPHAEEGAAPFVQQRLDARRAPDRRRPPPPRPSRRGRSASASASSACAVAGGRGRREPVRVLAREVQRVLQAPQRAARVFVVEPVRVAGDASRRVIVRASPVHSSPSAQRVALVASRWCDATSSDRNRYDRAPYGCAPSPARSSSTTTPRFGMLCRVNLELEGFSVREAGTLDRGGSRRRRRATRRRAAGRPPRRRGEHAPARATCGPTGIPVALVTGSADMRDLRCGGRGAAEAVRAAGARRRSRGGSLGLRREHRLRSQPDRVRVPPRALPLRALGGVARRARRREGGLGAGGDRPPLRRPLQPRAARRAARGRGARRAATAASCSTACARPASRASSRPSSPSARTSSRTACSRRASPSRARRCRSGTPRRSSRCSPAYADREELGEIQAEASAAFNDDRLELLARDRGARRPSCRASPDAVERNEEEKAISLRELSGRCTRRASTRPRATRRCATTLVRAPARRRPSRRPVELPHRLHAPAVAARVDVHEGARDRDLPADARGARLRPERRSRTSSSTSTTGRRSRRARA